MSESAARTHAIDVTQLLRGQTDATEAISAGTASVRLEDPTYEVAMKFLADRVATARYAATTIVTCAGLMIAFGIAFIPYSWWLTIVLWAVAGAMCATALVALRAAFFDQHRATRLQEQAVLNEMEMAIVAPGITMGRLSQIARALGIRSRA